jgi:hypothetical protein
MGTAKKCVITGINQINGVFYMLNTDTTDITTVWYTAGNEKKVRQECKRKIFDSKTDANIFVKALRRDPKAFGIKWSVETV